PAPRPRSRATAARGTSGRRYGASIRAAPRPPRPTRDRAIPSQDARPAAHRRGRILVHGFGSPPLPSRKTRALAKPLIPGHVPQLPRLDPAIGAADAALGLLDFG